MRFLRNGWVERDKYMHRVTEALLVELADGHGCLNEDDFGRSVGCEECADWALRLTARLSHERMI